MGDRESNCETSGKSSRIQGEKDESSTMGSLHSDSNSGQYPESEPSTRTENMSLQEDRIEVGDDLAGFTRFQRHFPRIFQVVARGDHNALSNILTNRVTEVNAIDSKGNTVLHHAVASACHKGDWDDKFYQCIDLLMNCEHLNVNRPNKNGYTAIGVAVHHLHRTCVKRMLEHPSADRLYLEYYPGDREYTLRETIIQTYPDLQPLLKERIKEDWDLSGGNMKLLAALQHGEYYTFKDNLDSNNPNPWYGEPYHSSLLEIACQMKKSELFVELLLASGADPNITNRVTGTPLLHATARSGNFEVLQLLLEVDGKGIRKKDNKQRTILHWLAGVSEREQGDKEKIEECFKLLLELNHIRQKDFEDRDRWGNTPLYIAVERGFRDRAKLLLSKGADVRVFESGSNVLLSDSVTIVKEILDDCLQSNDKPLTSKDLQLTLNYKPFLNIVPRIAESGLHRDLLTHPVMSTFLTIKWAKVRFFFILDMCFYVLFLCFLTAYILLYEAYNTVNDAGAASNTTAPGSFNDSYITSGINDSNSTFQTNSSSLQILQIFLMILLFFLTLREIAQLIIHRWVFIKSLENWLEILLIISTFISCSGVVESAELKHHFSAVAILLGWLELLMLLGRLPLLSVQHEMLRTVSLTFLWYMMGYITLLIAFALSFYIIFKRSSKQVGAKMFANIPVSLLKTIVMFTGEFDANGLTFDTLPYTSHVIFLLFVVLVAIILLNLLNGLAVSDTEVIRENAERLSLAARAKLISRIEGLVNALPKCMKISVQLKEGKFVIYPNRQNRIGSDNVRSLLGIISEKANFHENEKSSAFPEEWSTFTKKLSELECGQRKLEKKLDSMFEESRNILMQIETRLSNWECKTPGGEVET